MYKTGIRLNFQKAKSSWVVTLSRGMFRAPLVSVYWISYRERIYCHFDTLSHPHFSIFLTFFFIWQKNKTLQCQFFISVQPLHKDNWRKRRHDEDEVHWQTSVSVGLTGSIFDLYEVVVPNICFGIPGTHRWACRLLSLFLRNQFCKWLYISILLLSSIRLQLNSGENDRLRPFYDLAPLPEASWHLAYSAVQ